jgi:hypothetical protein
MPLLFVLVGLSIEKSGLLELNRGFLFSSALLIAMIPFIAQLLPELLSVKIASARQLLVAMLPITVGMLVLFLTPLVVALVARREIAGALLLLCGAVAGIYVKGSVYPLLDRQASARGLWREISPDISHVCEGGINRTWSYGLAFYNGHPLPQCGTGAYSIHLVQNGSGRPVVERVGSGQR